MRMNVVTLALSPVSPALHILNLKREGKRGEEGKEKRAEARNSLQAPKR